MNASSRNLAKAWGIIFVAVVCVVAIDRVLQDDPLFSLSEDGGSPPSISLKTVLGEAETSDMSSILPDDFEREVMSLADRDAVRVSEGGGVVGFRAEDQVEGVFEECASRLAERGWARIESGNELFASFIRAEGPYTWLYLSCVPIAGGTSVVIQFG